MELWMHTPEPELVPFLDVDFQFSPIDNGDVFPAGDDDEPFSDSRPHICGAVRGEASLAIFDTGPAECTI